MTQPAAQQMFFSKTNIVGEGCNPFKFEGITTLAFCLLANGLWAQGFRCPPVQPPLGGRFLHEFSDPARRLFFPKKWAAPEAKSCMTLPRWSAAELPFFCKIEHRVGQKLPLPFKFRLGSVQHVDWLEGKTRWGGEQ